jgi:hypothetical protein
MADRDHSPRPSQADAFAREAGAGQPGLLAELWAFLRHNKKWWLTPIVLVLLLVSVLVILGSSAAAPMIYTLF